MRPSPRHKAILLYGSTIFGAFVFIFLIVVTVFTQQFPTFNLTGLGILFIPAGLFFAFTIGWIISQELHPRKSDDRQPSANNIDEQAGAVDFQTKIHSVHSTIENMQTAYEQIQNFSANASHELRTPLTIMRGEVELALRSTKKPEEYQDLLGSLLEEIMRLSRILDDLLLIAKTEIGERPIEFQAIDLGELVEEIADEAEMFAELAGVTFSLESSFEVFIEAEPLRIRRVLLNLIDNAVKYNRKHGNVIMSMKKNGDMVSVCVRDTGIGIPKEAIPRLFERFYRVNDSASSTAKGTGLGLYLVKWIVKNHGGTITVESEQGKGSTFCVNLPIRNSGV
jgi:signal transduction histidine kinase